MTARFIKSDYSGGRIVLRSGEFNVGAVFPPAGEYPWTWRLTADRDCIRDGAAETEQAAKDALLAAWRDYLRRAGLVEARKTGDAA